MGAAPEGWRRAGQRNMAFTGQQARGGVQPNPAGAGQVHLAPGVQIGEIDLGAAGAIERFLVGLELDGSRIQPDHGCIRSEVPAPGNP